MKSNIIKILFLASFVMGVFSCTDDAGTERGFVGDGKTLRICLTSPKTTVINPLTKANQNDSKSVSDLNILIYNSDGNLIKEESEYLEEGSLQGLSENKNATFDLTVQPGEKTVYVIANAGDMRDILISTSAIDGYSFGLTSGGTPNLVMFAEGEPFDVSQPESSEVSAELKRIYSMVTVVVDASQVEGAIIEPQRVELKHVPLKGSLVGNNKITDKDGMFESGGYVSIQGLTAHENAPALYLYENRQPDGYSLTNTGIDKTPLDIYQKYSGIQTDPTIVSENQTCSYIEVTANYRPTGTEAGKPGTGTVTYRFFLGKNAKTSFDVERNVHYSITLVLKGKGGIDEGTWRVNTDLMEDFTVSDVYIGYLGGSTGIIPVSLPSGATVTGISRKSGDSENIFVNTSYDAQKKGIPVSSLLTNVSCDSYKHAIYTITVRYSSGKTGTKDVNVYQVARLVDPIAIYRRANNDAEETITVREFKRGAKDYETLASVGSYQVMIESGDWFMLESADGKDGIKGAGQFFERAEGEITFKYKPEGTIDNSKNRFGVILIKYNNKNCEHRIFLRQGYADTQMGDATWSVFNCLGKQQNNIYAWTEYPTQTGWLFKAGNSVAMNPFNPGYNDMTSMTKNSNEYYSDKQSRKWSNLSGSRSWTEKSNPCPSGYRLPTRDEYAKIAFSNNGYRMYQGFVYDDSSTPGTLDAGWYRDSSTGEIILNKLNNNCNPAKGTLIVDVKEGEDFRNLFFSYGKGVMTEHDLDYKHVEAGQDPSDIELDEIGVGFRNSNNGGFLNYGVAGSTKHHRYGAMYWTGTIGNLNTDNYLAADFWYDMTSQSDGTTSSYVVADIGGQNGMFVRCVKK